MKSRVEKSLIVPVSTPLESFSSRIRIKFSEVVCKDLTDESYHGMSLPACLLRYLLTVSHIYLWLAKV